MKKKVENFPGPGLTYLKFPQIFYLPHHGKVMSPKVLIVEDNQDTLELMRHYFFNAGFRVITALDGFEGFKRARTEYPDVIITDLSMPQLSGVDLIKKLTRKSRTAKIPILIFTAMGEEWAEAGLKAGAMQAYYKPYDFDNLVEEVKGLFDSSGNSQPSMTRANPEPPVNTASYFRNKKMPRK